MQYRNERYNPPLDKELTSRLTDFWRNIYQTEEDWLIPILDGIEKSYNLDTIFVTWHDDKIASTVHLTIPRENPWLGGMGEVATAMQHRRKGLALNLCRWAAEEFDKQGGEALFLGTGNPHAAYLYRQVGWTYIVGTKVMARIKDCVFPEEYIFSMYRDSTESSSDYYEMTATERITIIPLIVTPHPWLVLDMNVAMYSTRLAIQGSCMGLFPRYQTFWEKQQGKSWCLKTAKGIPIGIASVQRISNSEAHIDAFLHPYHLSRYEDFLDYIVCRTRDSGPRRITTKVLQHDFQKIETFRKAGFESKCLCGEIEVGGEVYLSNQLAYKIKR